MGRSIILNGEQMSVVHAQRRLARMAAAGDLLGHDVSITIDTARRTALPSVDEMGVMRRAAPARAATKGRRYVDLDKLRDGLAAAMKEPGFSAWKYAKAYRVPYHTVVRQVRGIRGEKRKRRA
jgi:hypothetical protein